MQLVVRRRIAAIKRTKAERRLYCFGRKVVRNAILCLLETLYRPSRRRRREWRKIVAECREFGTTEYHSYCWLVLLNGSLLTTAQSKEFPESYATKAVYRRLLDFVARLNKYGRYVKRRSLNEHQRKDQFWLEVEDRRRPTTMEVEFGLLLAEAPAQHADYYKAKTKGVTDAEYRQQRQLSVRVFSKLKLSAVDWLVKRTSKGY